MTAVFGSLSLSLSFRWKKQLLQLHWWLLFSLCLCLAFDVAAVTTVNGFVVVVPVVVPTKGHCNINKNGVQQPRSRLLSSSSVSSSLLFRFGSSSSSITEQTTTTSEEEATTTTTIKEEEGELAAGGAAATTKQKKKMKTTDPREPYSLGVQSSLSSSFHRNNNRNHEDNNKIKKEQEQQKRTQPLLPAPTQQQQEQQCPSKSPPPYRLSLKSNNNNNNNNNSVTTANNNNNNKKMTIMQATNTNDKDDFFLEPRMIRFQVNMVDPEKDQGQIPLMLLQNHHHSSLATTTASNNNKRRPRSQRSRDKDSNSPSSSSSYKNRPVLIPVEEPLFQSSSVSQQQNAESQQQTFPLSLSPSVPTTGTNRTTNTMMVTSPISLAENFLLLAPKMVSEVSSSLPSVLLWNASSSLWNYSSSTLLLPPSLWNYSSSTFLLPPPPWNTSAANSLWNASSPAFWNASSTAAFWNASSAAFWNTSSAFWNYSYYLPTTTTTMNNGSIMVTSPSSSSAGGGGGGAHTSLAENILQYMMESALMQPQQQQQFNNNNNNDAATTTTTTSAKTRGNGQGGSATPIVVTAFSTTTNYNNNNNNNNNKQNGTAARTKTLTQFRPKSKVLGFPMQNNQLIQQPEDSSSSQILLDSFGKDPDDTLTLKDLDRILRANGYVRQSELSSIRQGLITSTASDLEGVGKPVTAQQHALKAATSTSSKNVAFPQPSVLSYTSLKWGTTLSATFVFLLLSTAVLPNLWLVGGLAGALYGYDIGKQLPERTPTAVIPGMLVRLGTRLARTSLQLYDYCVALMFMWKTGVLSYEYWKKYAVLDRKFKIQDKMDAWNARFIEGKENFDKWERENEVGRKVLAAVRTFWLVEERSFQKGLKQRQQRKQSKYRIVQFVYDVAYSLGRILGSVVKRLTGSSISGTELKEFFRGITMDISQARIAARMGAVVAALITINIVGAWYTISPTLLLSAAVVISLIWPSWFHEFTERVGQFLEDTRAIGRGETTIITTKNNNKKNNN